MAIPIIGLLVQYTSDSGPSITPTVQAALISGFHLRPTAPPASTDEDDFEVQLHLFSSQSEPKTTTPVTVLSDAHFTTEKAGTFGARGAWSYIP